MSFEIGNFYGVHFDHAISDSNPKTRDGISFNATDVYAARGSNGGGVIGTDELTTVIWKISNDCNIYHDTGTSFDRNLSIDGPQGCKPWERTYQALHAIIDRPDDGTDVGNRCKKARGMLFDYLREKGVIPDRAIDDPDGSKTKAGIHADVDAAADKVDQLVHGGGTTADASSAQTTNGSSSDTSSQQAKAQQAKDDLHKRVEDASARLDALDRGEGATANASSAQTIKGTSSHTSSQANDDLSQQAKEIHALLDTPDAAPDEKGGVSYPPNSPVRTLGTATPSSTGPLSGEPSGQAGSQDINSLLLQAEFANLLFLDRVGKGQKEGLKATDLQRQQMVPLIIKKTNEALDKMSAQKKSGFFQKVFDWVSKIAAVVAAAATMVAAAAATAATGGAATPLLVAAAVATTVATVDLASQASQELGGPEFSAGSLGKEVAKAMGASDQTAGWVDFGVNLGLQIACAAILIRSGRGLTEAVSSVNAARAGGGASRSAASADGAGMPAAEAGEAADASANTARSGAVALQGVASAGGGVTSAIGAGSQAVSAGFSIDMAQKGLEADEKKADAKRYQATMQRLQGVIEDLLKDLQDAVEKITSTAVSIGKTVDDDHQSKMAIIAGPRAGVMA